MDFRDLLQLAEGNTSLSKKKIARQFGKNDSGTNNVSSSAVSKFLAKKKNQMEMLKAQEIESRRKRVLARLKDADKEARIVKIDTAKQKPIKPLTSKPENAVKQKAVQILASKQIPEKKTKAEENVKKKTENPMLTTDQKLKSNLANKSAKEKHSEIEKGGNSSSSRIHSKKDSERAKTPPSVYIKKKSEPKHRKSTQRIANNNNKKVASGLSFTQLAAMAKTNSVTASVDKLNSLKRINPKETQDFDPDRYVKVKKAKSKSKKQDSTTSSEYNICIENKHGSKSLSTCRNGNIKNSTIRKSDNSFSVSNKAKPVLKPNSNKKTSVLKSNEKQVKNTFIDPIKPAVKRGLITETISDTRNSGKETISKQKQVYRGIAAQNKSVPNKKSSKQKKSVNDYEDEFDKEEKLLARKRKLFEMKRITGNRDLREEDIIDDYDLDDEDSFDDDFIDDDDAESQNVSKYISKIFGYDKSRYVNCDEEDLQGMEANYSQIEKEEARSARIAKIEDEYEAMKEQEELRRLASKAKKKKK